MGMVGLVEISLQCFDVLAWPLLALVYPLCCSIRAIETNSISDTQRLNTYWVVFSLILLLEHAFLKLLERLPLWHYIRIMVALSLVIPHFDGAFYVYKHLICPCLTMDPQSVTNWFNKWRKELLFVSKDVRAEVERYVKENVPEALERTIACEAEPNFTGTENSKYTSREIKGKTTEVAEGVSGDRLKRNLIMNFKENVQGQQRNINEVLRMKGSRLWCNICSVSCPGEIDMASHLSGRQHKENVQEQQQNANKAPMKNDPPLWCSICHVRCTGEIDVASHLSGRKHKENVQEQQQNAKKAPRKNEPPLWCKVCNVGCSGQITLASHLNGNKHKEKVQEQQNTKKNGPPLWCKICNVGCSGQITLASHLNGNKHKEKVQEQHNTRSMVQNL
ncbi:zinc finger protein 346-like [Prunus avium]|uniref:Zinc finger protein 346-like n=1 Tax=Prunus avium TaxID=42229 RepID=A0A6P5SFK6_PRUAV|nr:zinc finger protein 346-like [Prunus avium]